MDVLGISLKVGQRGTSKTYVVKNIYKFLQIYQEKSYLANKQTEFLLTSEAFDQTNNDILIRLLGIAQTQQLIGQAGIQVKGKLDKSICYCQLNTGKNY